MARPTPEEREYDDLFYGIARAQLQEPFVPNPEWEQLKTLSAQKQKQVKTTNAETDATLLSAILFD